MVSITWRLVGRRWASGAGFEDFAIDNEGRTVPGIAADILNQVGWIHRTLDPADA